jgi:hypothetical protein
MGKYLKVALGVLLALAVRAHAQTTLRVEDLLDPSESDQRKILAQVTGNALQYAAGLPDFVCTEVTRHNVDQTGSGRYWRLAGTIDGELSYTSHKSDYRILKVNGKEDNSDHNLLGGFAPPDAFGGLLSWIFDTKFKTSFKWNSWTALEKRPTYVFAYTVPQQSSQLAATAKARESVGFYGNVYIDSETKQIMRINVVGQSPPKVLVRDINFDVDYALEKIGDKEYPLPAKANFRVRDNKRLVWDEIEFRHYRTASEPKEKFSQRKPE